MDLGADADAGGMSVRGVHAKEDGPAKPCPC